MRAPLALTLTVVVATITAAAPASAQPVTYELQGDVAIGHKPQIKIRAIEPVTDVRFELERDDGKKFTAKQAALAKGQTAILPIGDGAAGKAIYKGTVSAQGAAESQRWSDDLTFETLVRAPVKVTYDAEHLDLDKHELQFKLSPRAGSAELVVIGDDGKHLGTGTATYDRDPAADAWVAITWKQPAGTRVMKLQLHAVAANGLATDLELVPWSVTIDHEDVNFATDRAAIDPGEETKLDASLAKIDEIVKRSEKFVAMKLFVAGHTDTVGSAASNRKLSLDRARAIATYLRRKGLALPIAYAGFGEDVLKVKTPDNTDERANRRADYVIGPAAGAPPFKGPYLKAHAAWKQLPSP